jgi:hypothetical protein
MSWYSRITTNECSRTISPFAPLNCPVPVSSVNPSGNARGDLLIREAIELVGSHFRAIGLAGAEIQPGALPDVAR